MNASKLFTIAGALLGVAQNTIPIFIHNPKSQAIEGVVITDVDYLFETLATILNSQPAAPQAAAPSAALKAAS